MDPISDRREMIAGMTPVLEPGRFVFCTVRQPVEDPDIERAVLASIKEREGLSLILPVEKAGLLGADLSPVMRQITLMVNSSLEGVGLTAAVASALADAGIPCNMVAGNRHDHVFVPEGVAEEALGILMARQARENG